MARIRSIHPSLWTDEEFVQMTMPARLFYVGLWNEADDYGIFEWRPVRLKMRLMPADDVDPVLLLGELLDHRFVVKIERGGKEYGLVKNFRVFQRPKHPSAPLVTVDEEIASVIGLKGSPSPTVALPQPAPKPTVIPPQVEGVVVVPSSLRSDGADALLPGLPEPDDPPPIKTQLFGPVLDWLKQSTGRKEAGLRSQLGKWCSQHGDGSVLQAVIEIQSMRGGPRLDPVSAIEEVFKRRPNGRAGPLNEPQNGRKTVIGSIT